MLARHGLPQGALVPPLNMQDTWNGMDAQDGGGEWSGGQAATSRGGFLPSSNSILDMDDETRAEFNEVRQAVPRQGLVV